MYKTTYNQRVITLFCNLRRTNLAEFFKLPENIFQKYVRRVAP
jgi:hypothetical protein